MSQAEVIASNIKAFRKERGLSQTQVAKYLGVDQGLVSKMETGGRSVTVATMEKLCDLFFCSMSDLMAPRESLQQQVAFRTDDLQPEDLEALAAIGRIARNLGKMTALEGQADDQ